LAAILKLHRKTIIAAYDELAAQGWTTVMPRKGFIVAENLPDIKPRRWDNDATGYAFNSTMPSTFYPVSQAAPFVPAPRTRQPHLIVDDGHPDTRLAPMVQLHREYRGRLKQQHVVKQVSAALAAGSLKLREAMVAYMAQTRGMQVQADNILMTHGAQMSIYLAACLLLKPGDYIIVGEPGYYMANQVFEHLGAQIIRVPVDSQGIDITAVENVCKKQPIKALYVVPHHHHPTTVTLSPDKRMRLLEIAEQFNFTIIEDDYDYDFHYTSSPYLPLAAGNHRNRVVYIGSFSKALSATIRIGFMIAAGDFLKQATFLRRMIDLRGDHVMEESLAALIENGDIGRHLKKVNKVYRERRDYLCTLLDAHLKNVVQYTRPDGGMAIWLTFNKNHPLTEISAKAAKHGLFINNGKLFDSQDVGYNALRFGFASLNLEEIKEAVEIIASVL
jgi:GntR family transcriptional regulator / MocR family aminotransferase